MYNENIKHKFVEYIKGSKNKNFASSFFRRIESTVEVKAGKDIATMARSEILRGLEDMHYINYASIRADLSILKQYAEWYNNNVGTINLQSIKSIFARDLDLSKSIYNEIVENEDELIGIISYAPASDGYAESPVLLLSWSGLTLEEILQLKNDDVVFRGSSAFIQTQRKLLQIDSEHIVTALKEYKSVKSSTRAHRSNWTVFPDDLGYYIKNMVTENSRFAGKPMVASNIRKKVEHYCRLLPDEYKKVSVDDVLLSGRLRRILEYEIKFETISPDIIVNEFRIKMPLLNDYLSLYEQYKKAFNINTRK